MDYELSDSSDTDDDLPPSNQNRLARRGKTAGNGRSMVNSVPYSRTHSDMETQIHHLEQEAYSSVLRAFQAQSDAISWEKEGLITELRKELRVSDDEHRELLSRVNADDLIRRIREWRQAGGLQVHDPVHTPTVSASHKKQKMSQPMPSVSLGVSSPALHCQSVAASMQPSAPKQGAPPLGAGGKRPKPPMKYPSTGSTGRGQFANRSSSGAPMSNEPAEAAASFDSLIGRKVMTRWPEDNNFYEAVITDYNPHEGRHALVYDIRTANETWEWVDLKEISPEDIRWVGEDPGISHREGPGGQGHGVKKSMSHGGAAPPAAGTGRGRGGFTKVQSRKEFPSSQNGIGNKLLDDIEILSTDTLVKEVERLFSASNPDPFEFDKAKKMLKEHEQALIDAITKLADASDGESDVELRRGHESMIEEPAEMAMAATADQQEDDCIDDI
ncbi:protein EMSY-LIKE 3 isoform X2 [Malania oleifera]|uniref:protein EMSY-LIKE 3 isoform X2 n=1 Tax=Malania oleifera TaxID=397392 RepID=UPI0025AE72F5|nr:protein EMSY-LIKE 3 isoform X2 [Malania oleifera]